MQEINEIFFLNIAWRMFIAQKEKNWTKGRLSVSQKTGTVNRKFETAIKNLFNFEELHAQCNHLKMMI